MQVSVVMPIYNGKKFITRAINSLSKQTFSDFEIICVDDGSTDDSVKILEQLAKKEKRLVIIKTKHQGIVHALNKGIAKAKGTYIARMDVDDISHHTRIAQQAHLLDNNPGIGVVGCYVRNGAHIRTYPVWDKKLKDMMFFATPFAHGSIMIRKHLLKQIGGYKQGTDLVEDLDLYFRLKDKTRFSTIPLPLYTLTTHSESQTHRRTRNMIMKTVNLRTRHLQDQATITVLIVYLQYLLLLFPTAAIRQIFYTMRNRYL